MLFREKARKIEAVQYKRTAEVRDLTEVTKNPVFVAVNGDARVEINNQRFELTLGDWLVCDGGFYRVLSNTDMQRLYEPFA